MKSLLLVLTLVHLSFAQPNASAMSTSTTSESDFTEQSSFNDPRVWIQIDCRRTEYRLGDPIARNCQVKDQFGNRFHSLDAEISGVGRVLSSFKIRCFANYRELRARPLMGIKLSLTLMVGVVAGVYRNEEGAYCTLYGTNQAFLGSFFGSKMSFFPSSRP